ncbi:eukaryotic translation initiation factor 5A [Dictyostelium discoideum AX4]|uniref:Eukaryotic translation initiation factor 5A n=1 Tax=Dictyostelium discoideum TaxID=44689 RepID=IF5A_DICDI|nr:eukaryotic translation initiation factor 5A [Dictyostelium discoideum AX4]P13651.2 RecName: Full=Eukaryotic translation initiation factor 5A; Short=eIF-5A; AltName: Full=eIF-4D [Dictyostelium discoideum]EAL64894.1 eukaryotic translation initiation factor 5A [Dictyostelium discoideum AX4]|eukprot:XP_639978.1 eukaryotic translation initiation factor 5A [Dictyostelium discoideum AX4]
MSDNEALDVEDYAQAGSGASLTFPIQCSALRKNGFVVIKGFPCKIVDMSTSKTGKHGHAKVNITAIDIFTGKKYEEICPSTHNIDVPNVSRKEYTVMDVQDGYLSLLDAGGEVKEDLALPEDDIGKEITQMLKEGKEPLVSVISALGKEGVVSVKVSNN